MSVQDYEATLRGVKEPVRFKAARLFHGADVTIAYNDEDKETLRYQTKDVIMLRSVEPGTDQKVPYIIPESDDKRPPTGGPKFGGFDEPSRIP